MKDKTLGALYVRNVIFGVEDSLVSTVGFLSGIASVHMPVQTILLVGFVYICVEGFSMAAGSFLSEESTEEYTTGQEVPVLYPILGGLAMLVSSIGAGLLPIIPYMLFSGTTALYTSVVASLTALGVLGFVHARIAKLPVTVRVIRMMLIGGAAIGIGVLVGKLFGI